MFATATVLATFVLVTLSEASGERVKCQMVPLQTSNGLMGMCCVFVKNMSASDIRNSLMDSAVVHFPDEKKTENKITMPDTKNKEVAFPGTKHGENKKNSTSSKTETKKKVDNSTTIYFPNPEHKNATSDKNSTFSLENRNKNDTPETCTDGKKKDLDGNCVNPF